MAGAKGKKRRFLKRKSVEQRKQQEEKKRNETNPFELRINKVSHNVLGRKIAKNEMGKPLLNRSRAIQKRTQTLLKEYETKHKGGKGLQDLRDVNSEQRLITKYKEEQNKILFDQNEQINLTHKGKPLEDFIDDRISSDDEDLDLFNRENFVETTHFGGGDEGAPRTANEVLNDILEEKRLKKIEKEETILLTEKLDNQWNEVKALIRHKGSNQSVTKDNRDDYDNLLTQLMFEGDMKTPTKQPEQPAVLPASTQTVSAEQPSNQTLDSLFKFKMKSISTSNDIDFVIKTLKEVLDLLPNVGFNSHSYIKEQILELSETSLKFTPNEICKLIVGSYFKNLQVMIHLLILKTLQKIKYSNYHEVAMSIFLNNFLLKTMNSEKFYPEIFIHLDNLIRLCSLEPKVTLNLFHRLNYEAETLLSFSKFHKLKHCEMSSFRVTPESLFNRIFFDATNPDIIAYNLCLQIFQLLNGLFEKYSESHVFQTIASNIANNVSELSKVDAVCEQLRVLLTGFLTKYSQSKPPPIVNDIRPKPLILPMLEPRFEEKLRTKPLCDDKKKLTKKYKRELKGAQREIRKDSIFMRNVYLKEVERKDRIRKQKVKQLLNDLSAQQGLYKKKK